MKKTLLILIPLVFLVSSCGWFYRGPGSQRGYYDGGSHCWDDRDWYRENRE